MIIRMDQGKRSLRGKNSQGLMIWNSRGRERLGKVNKKGHCTSRVGMRFDLQSEPAVIGRKLRKTSSRENRSKCDRVGRRGTR